MPRCFPIPALLLLALIPVGCDSSGGPTDPSADSKLSVEAEAYLTEVLDIMQANSINRYKLDWVALRARVIEHAGAAQETWQTYDAIRLGIELLGDNHSFFREPSGLSLSLALSFREAIPPSGKHLGFGIGYVEVPAFSGSYDESKALAEEYHAIIRSVDTLGVCGWIVDLRGNTGGNMWPMIAGIGPIAGEGILGFFVDPDSVVKVWSYENGSSRLDGVIMTAVEDPYELEVSNPPVAVLTNSRTASSGEATAVAFRGREKARSFGEPTWGVSTANRAFSLSDGAMLILTVSTMADRTGQLYGGKLQPDHQVKVGLYKNPDPQLDAGIIVAVDWLMNQPECVGF